MRTDELGQVCPATLGEYRDLVFALVRDVENPAVVFLDWKIRNDPEGRGAEVFAADSEMRVVLFALMQRGLAGGES